MTTVLKTKGITAADVAQVARSLESGGLACLPTDTVYGLAGLARLPGVLERICQVKGREPTKPMAVVFHAVQDIFDALPSLAERIRNVIAKLMPGPVTVIVPAAAHEKSAMGMAEADGIGLRVICPPLGKLYKALPGPLVLTSANRSGQPDPCSAEEISPSIREACDFVVDAGRLPGCIPSTVADLRPLAGGGKVLIMREGAVPRQEIEKRIEGCGCF